MLFRSSLFISNLQTQLENYNKFGPPKISSAIMTVEDKMFVKQFRELQVDGVNDHELFHLLEDSEEESVDEDSDSDNGQQVSVPSELAVGLGEDEEPRELRMGRGEDVHVHDRVPGELGVGPGEDREPRELAVGRGEDVQQHSEELVHQDHVTCCICGVF